jgi:hypothetical protein
LTVSAAWLGIAKLEASNAAARNAFRMQSSLVMAAFTVPLRGC